MKLKKLIAKAKKSIDFYAEKFNTFSSKGFRTYILLLFGKSLRKLFKTLRVLEGANKKIWKEIIIPPCVLALFVENILLNILLRNVRYVLG